MVTPVGAVQVAMVDGTAVVHPTKEQLKISPLRLIIAGKIWSSGVLPVCGPL
jgi:polyribonucleotide nucleotidyltransferase